MALIFAYITDKNENVQYAYIISSSSYLSNIMNSILDKFQSKTKSKHKKNINSCLIKPKVKSYISEYAILSNTKKKQSITQSLWGMHMCGWFS